MPDLKLLNYVILLTIISLLFAPTSKARDIEEYQLPISKLTLELELTDELAEPIKQKISRYIYI